MTWALVEFVAVPMLIALVGWAYFHWAGKRLDRRFRDR